MSPKRRPHRKKALADKSPPAASPTLERTPVVNSAPVQELAEILNEMPTVTNIPFAVKIRWYILGCFIPVLVGAVLMFGAVNIRLANYKLYGPILDNLDPHAWFRHSQKITALGSYKGHILDLDHVRWYPRMVYIQTASFFGMPYIISYTYRFLHYWLKLPVTSMQIAVLLGPIVTPIASIFMGLLSFEAFGSIAAAAFTAGVSGYGIALISNTLSNVTDNDGVAVAFFAAAMYFWARALRGPRSGRSGRSLLSILSLVLFAVLTGITDVYARWTWGGSYLITVCFIIHSLGWTALGIITDKPHAWRLTMAFAVETLTVVSLSRYFSDAVSYRSTSVRFDRISLAIAIGLITVGIFRGLLQQCIHNHPRLKSYVARMWTMLVVVFIASVTVMIVDSRLLVRLLTYLKLDQRIQLYVLGMQASVSFSSVSNTVAEHKITPYRVTDRTTNHLLTLSLVTLPLLAFYCRRLHAFLTVAIFAVTTWFVGSMMMRISFFSCLAGGLGVGSLTGVALDRLIWIIGWRYPNNQYLQHNIENRDDHLIQTRDKLIEVLESSSVAFRLRFLLNLTLLILGSTIIWRTTHLPPNVGLRQLALVNINQNKDGAYYLDFSLFQAFHNIRRFTDPHARIFAWWDYGYWIQSISHRSTFHDGQTYIHSIMAMGGYQLVNPPDKSHAQIRKFADYIYVDKSDPGKMLNIARVAYTRYPELCASLDCMEFSNFKGRKFLNSLFVRFITSGGYKGSKYTEKFRSGHRMVLVKVNDVSESRREYNARYPGSLQKEFRGLKK